MSPARKHQRVHVWEDTSVVLILLRVRKHQQDATLACMHVGRHQHRARGNDLLNSDPPLILL
jgi:hypothetical protein